MDIEDFLRDYISIEEHAPESDPINYLSRFIVSYLKSPQGEEDNDRIDKQSEIGKGDTKNHGTRMYDNAGTRNRCIDITPTRDCDSLDRIEELIGF